MTRFYSSLVTWTLSLLVAILAICYIVSSCKEEKCVKHVYTVECGYLDGKCDTLLFTQCKPPRVEGSRGNYYLITDDSLLEGVCRVKVLRVDGKIHYVLLAQHDSSIIDTIERDLVNPPMIRSNEDSTELILDKEVIKGINDFMIINKH